MTYPHTQDQGYQGQGQGQGDPNFDWTTGQPTAADNYDDFEIGGVTMNKDADEIEQDRARRPVPAGEHEFIVQGLYKAPEMVVKNGYLKGQSVSWTAYKIGVRLALASDPAATVLDFFETPPVDRREQEYYLNASKNPDGKNPGFMAEKFGHFIARLGWPYGKGQPMPADARRPANWKGRRVIATVELTQDKDPITNQPKLNPATGEPYPPRAQLKLFSYKPAMATLAGQVPPIQQAPAPAQAPSQAQHQPQYQPQAPTAQQAPTAPPAHPADRFASLRGNL